MLRRTKEICQAIHGWRMLQRSPKESVWSETARTLEAFFLPDGENLHVVDSRTALRSRPLSNTCSPADVEGVMLLPMPKLSHAMTHGRIAKWHVREGAPVATYDVILTVETETLVEEAYRLDQFSGKVALLVESQEEGFMARILVQEGQEIPVGRPIAVLCERAEDVDDVRKRTEQGDYGAQRDNVYEHHGEPPLRLLEWQSYLATGPPSSGCL